MDFTQGTTTDNPLWNAVRNFLAPPTEEDIICHFPKPILLATGKIYLAFWKCDTWMIIFTYRKYDIMIVLVQAIRMIYEKRIEFF